MTYTAPDPVSSGRPYSVVAVGDEHPSALDQFVGERRFTIGNGGESAHVSGLGIARRRRSSVPRKGRAQRQGCPCLADQQPRRRNLHRRSSLGVLTAGLLLDTDGLVETRARDIARGVHRLITSAQARYPLDPDDFLDAALTDLASD